MLQGRSITSTTTILSAVTIALLAFLGGWQRRWMSDDGLIVLRTVRNILAGNGPVFNAGERVEANTSTLWQYLITLVAMVSDAPLEWISTWLALGFTILALVVATLATARLYQQRNSLLLVPFGVLIYIALPPARDFATSGLEWGLSLTWIAVQWWLLVRWVLTPRSERGWLILAFWSGLSWLVRPELALYGGLAGLLLLVAATTWRQRCWILVAALPLPAAYQVFRMGYYGLLVPHTAVAKSASGAQWASGWNYIMDLVQAYQLWWVLLLLVVAVLWLRRLNANTPTQVHNTRLRKPAIVLALMLLSGALHLIYVARVGGDFMHGRMLLLPLFTLLLPLAVLPIWELEEHAAADKPKRLSVFTGLVTFALMSIWAVVIVLKGHGFVLEDANHPENLGVVDEREFWMQYTKRSPENPPILAQDFLDIPIMNDYEQGIERARAENASMLMTILKDPAKKEFSWIPMPRGYAGDLEQLPPTLTLLNLGMTSMNAPLDVRVLDNMGLATPIAARQPRVEDARIGHDKSLPLEWQLAESSMNLGVELSWVDMQLAREARDALYTEDVVELFETYRAPLDFQRWLSNTKFALTLGRTLELSPDPADYADKPHVDRAVFPIAFPTEIKLDEPRVK